MAVNCETTEHRQAIELLCSKALEGNLRLDDFYREWPCQATKGSFWEGVYGDLEDGVQHSPGTWVGGKVDLSQWRECWEYFVIYVDLLLLRSNADPARLLKVRQDVLSAKRTSLVEAEARVARALTSAV
jgi:hypothetical protein